MQIIHTHNVRRQVGQEQKRSLPVGESKNISNGLRRAILRVFAHIGLLAIAYLGGLQIAHADRCAGFPCCEGGIPVGNHISSLDSISRLEGSPPLSVEVNFSGSDWSYDPVDPNSWSPYPNDKHTLYFDWGEGAIIEFPSRTEVKTLPGDDRPYAYQFWSAQTLSHVYPAPGQYQPRFGVQPGPCPIQWENVWGITVSNSDSDGDGVPDSQDSCANEAGPASNNGCPVPPLDADGDGIPDVNDSCPNEAGPASTGGCPVATDTDQDGIPDQNDSCPTQAGPASTGGCPISCDFSTAPGIERCFGGIGVQCEGIPVVAPFKKNSKTCRVSGWMSMGSILHDTCCVVTKNNGVHCAHPNGTNLCQSEWDEAVANTACTHLAGATRQWRRTFGPYYSGNTGDRVPQRLRAPRGARVNPKYQRLCASGRCRAGSNGNDNCGEYCVCQ